MFSGEDTLMQLQQYSSVLIDVVIAKAKSMGGCGIMIISSLSG
jgi:hypothetical protein